MRLRESPWQTVCMGTKHGCSVKRKCGVIVGCFGLQVFYATPATSPEIKGYWCHACYSEVKGEIMEIDGSQVWPHILEILAPKLLTYIGCPSCPRICPRLLRAPAVRALPTQRLMLAESLSACHQVRKSEVVKRKNDEEQEEGWVACDCCERWVHQICGLFNKGRNDKDNQYICPMCLLQGKPEAAAWHALGWIWDWHCNPCLTCSSSLLAWCYDATITLEP